MMNEPAVLLCGHGSRDPEAIEEFEQAAAALRAAPRAAAISRPAISNSPARRSARRWPACAARGARRDPGGAGHAVRREPRQERPAVGDEQLYGRAIPGSRCGSAAISAIDPNLLAAAADRIAAVAPAAERADIAARRRRPRHQRPRRQLQHRQDRAHAVGGAGVRLGRGGVQRRRASAGRRGARPRGAARLPPHRRVSVFPVHRRSGQAHLRRRPTRPPPAFPQIEFVKAPLSARPSAGHRRLSRPHRRMRDRRLRR